jgi:hypothetical protein
MNVLFTILAIAGAVTFLLTLLVGILYILYDLYHEAFRQKDKFALGILIYVVSIIVFLIGAVGLVLTR